MIQVGNGSLQEAEQEYGIKEFDDLDARSGTDEGTDQEPDR